MNVRDRHPAVTERRRSPFYALLSFPFLFFSPAFCRFQDLLQPLSLAFQPRIYFTRDRKADPTILHQIPTEPEAYLL